MLWWIKTKHDLVPIEMVITKPTPWRVDSECHTEY